MCVLYFTENVRHCATEQNSENTHFYGQSHGMVHQYVLVEFTLCLMCGKLGTRSYRQYFHIILFKIDVLVYYFFRKCCPWPLHGTRDQYLSFVLQKSTDVQKPYNIVKEGPTTLKSHQQYLATGSLDRPCFSANLFV